MEPPRTEPAPSYAGSKEGRLVWTGELQAGQEVDVTAHQADSSASGALPGVPVSIEVHPATVHVVTPPSPANQWRHLVIRNDGKKLSFVVVSWKVRQ